MIDAAFSLPPVRKSVESTIRLPCSIIVRDTCAIARPDNHLVGTGLIGGTACVCKQSRSGLAAYRTRKGNDSCEYKSLFGVPTVSAAIEFFVCRSPRCLPRWVC